MSVGELPQMLTSRLVVGLGTLVHTKVEDGAVVSPQAVRITAASKIAMGRTVASIVDGPQLHMIRCDRIYDRLTRGCQSLVATSIHLPFAK